MHPAPETCAHNLHRDPDPGEEEGPQPTDLCRNGLGAFHMLDCPLFLGRPCSQFEEAEQPHPVTRSSDVAATRALLRRDFLRWPYRSRVRALESGAAPVERHVIEAVSEPESEPGEDLDFALVGSDELPEPEPPPEEEEPPSEELYPGQRRSEDLRKPRPAAAAREPEPDPEPGVAETPAVEVEAPEPDPEPDRPKSLDEVFDVLPEAPDLPEPARGRRRGPRRAPRRRSGRGRKPAGAPASGGSPAGSGKAPRGKDGGGAEKPARRRRRRRRRPPGGGSSKPSE